MRRLSLKVINVNRHHSAVANAIELVTEPQSGAAVACAGLDHESGLHEVEDDLVHPQVEWQLQNAVPAIFGALPRPRTIVVVEAVKLVDDRCSHDRRRIRGVVTGWVIQRLKCRADGRDEVVGFCTTARNCDNIECDKALVP